MAEIPAGVAVKSDREFAVQLIEKNGVASVPASSFYENRQSTGQIRFCFCKSYATLEEANRRLQPVRC